MNFHLKPTDASKIEADVLIVFGFEKDFFSQLPDFGVSLQKELREAASREDFEGKDSQFLIITTRGQIGAYKLILVGMGKEADFDLGRLYLLTAKAVKRAKEYKPAKVGIVMPPKWMDKIGTKESMRALVEAVSLSSYKFIKYKSEEEKNKLRNIEEVILQIPAGKIKLSEEGLKLGKVTSEAALFARDLVNEPAQVTTPSFLANVALELGKASKGVIKAKILEKEEVSRLGMGAFLGVARGSDELPKFIYLKYKPTSAKKKVVIIGKGITFDTGGLSLKNSSQMETMKLDMAGAAAVLAIFKVIPYLLPSCEVVGLVAACENMPSGRALKPGDILKALNGKTIEVLNTDAEGRLTLADALSFASIKEKADEIIDLATLTGACMVALGEEIAGLWGNNDELVSNIEKSAADVGEKIWRMPLEEEYKDLIKSHIADIKNTQTGRYGGAITAALFLKEFVGETPWVHIDIAGPAYAEKDTPLTSYGGSGFGVRTVLHYLSSV